MSVTNGKSKYHIKMAESLIIVNKLRITHNLLSFILLHISRTYVLFLKAALVMLFG